MSDAAAAIDAEGIALKREHPARATIKRLLRHRLFMTGLVLFLIIAGIAILAPWITDTDPNRLSMPTSSSPLVRAGFLARIVSGAVFGPALCGARSFPC